MKLKSFFVLLGMLILGVCLCVQALAAEVEDASFEEIGGGYWSGWNTKGFNRNFDALEEAHSGDQSYQVFTQGVSPAWGAAIASQILAEDMTPGDKFEASVWMKIPNSGSQDKAVGLKNAQTYLEVVFYNGEGYEENNEVKKFKSKNFKKPMDWTKVVVSDEVPEGAIDCKMQLVVNSPNGGKVKGSVYFDDTSLR